MPNAGRRARSERLEGLRTMAMKPIDALMEALGFVWELNVECVWQNVYAQSEKYRCEDGHLLSVDAT